MAIINISSVSVVKGTPATITLDKAALAALPIVSGDAYFSVQANWYEVIVYYVSTEGHQKESLVFDASLASPTADFYVTSDARDVFDVQNLVIRDFNNGYLNITRDELIAEGVDVAADFDVDFGVVPPVGAIAWNILGSNLSTDSNGGLTSTNSGWGVANTAFSSITTGDNAADWTYIFNMNMPNAPFREFSCGTNRNTTVTLAYDDVDYGFHVNQAGNVDISIQRNYASVPNVATISTGPNEFKIVYTQSDYTVKFYVNSVLVHTQTGGSGYFTVFPTSYPIFAFYNRTSEGLSLTSSSVDFPVPPSNFVVWDNYSPSLTPEADGGLTGTGTWTSANAYSEASKFTGSGDFAFTMNVNVALGSLTSLHGIKTSTPDINATGYDNHSFGFYINNVGTLFVSFGSSYEFLSTGPLTAGSHTLKIARESGDLKFYVDSVLVYSLLLFSDTTIYPYASNYNGGMIITSSTMG